MSHPVIPHRPNATAVGEALLAIFLTAWVPLTVKYIDANTVAIGIVRLTIAGLCLGLWLLPQLKTLRLSGRDWGVLAALGFFFALHWYTYFLAIKTATAALGSLSFSTYGVHLLILGWFFQGNRPAGRDLLAIFIALTGTVIIIPELSFDNSMTLGVGIGVASGFFYAFLPILHQRNQHISSGVRALGQFFFGLLFFLLLWPQADWSFPALQWWHLLFLGVVCTFFGHTLWVRATTVLPVATIGVINYLYAPLAVFLSALIIAEPISAATLLGTVLIVGANIIALPAWQRGKVHLGSG